MIKLISKSVDKAVRVESDRYHDYDYDKQREVYYGDLGLFWYIPDEDRFITKKYSLDAEVQKDPKSNFVTAPAAHYLVWHTVNSKHSSNYYPRGRINYRLKDNLWEVGIDRCIPETAVAKLLEDFGLTRGEVVIVQANNHSGIAGDHYSCHQCNPSIEN